MPWTHRNRKGQSVARITPLSARMELAGFGYAPLEEYPGITTAKWKARHLECGNEVSIRLHVLRQGRGCCMPCGAKKHGSTRSLDPGKAFEAMLSANLEPLEPYPGSVGKAWKSRCLVCGDIVAPPRYANVASGQGGCRACGARKRAASRRWNEEGAVRIMLSMSLKPLEPFPGMRHKWKALCLRCGKTVFPLLDNVRKGSGCRYCGWATSTLRQLGDPVEAATDLIEAGYEPLEDYPGVNRPWSCIHTPCGTRVAVKLAKVRSGFNPCPRCKTNGFDQEAPALVYVLHHSGFNSVKVGVTSTKSDRVRGFQSAGWVMVHCEQFAVGRTAWGVEQEVLRHIREDLGYPPYLSRDVMGSLGGWRLCADLLPPFNLQTMVQETARSAR